ncbi:DNA-dependent ATPase mgs1 [Coemansia erecta]|uniref:DNA-dependent ATPase mgs1 n=1 Tax=Coemansia erecta TaxID=147472 RepID=A0A9W7Y7Z3_9FUNG|nr:DNA-dependent ATPase mgs1 [Coemansia erecta]
MVSRPGLGDDMIIDVDNENSVPIQTTSGSDTPVISKPAANQPRQKVGSVASDLTEADRRLGNKKLPLAERLRPLTLDAFVGQRGLVGPGGVLRTLIESDKICSCIFWGNPGLGKTTLARIISRQTNAAFKEMSAVTQNISDVKKAIEEAGNLSRLANKRTIVFLDEIHRFNKAQQDVFLPYLERGQIILIAIAVKAAKVKQRDLGQPDIGFEGEIATYIAKVSDGDARVAIGVVDIAMDSLASDSKLDMECIRRALQRTHIVYSAEEHYDLISALHKSVRGSDANAALYWLGRMLQGGDDPLYIARRLVRMASEDIGLADNHALPLAMSTLQACQAIGMPECDTVLAHCVVYLARAPKSVESYMAFKNVKACVDSEHPWPVPMHIRNAPTRMMKQMGYGDGYKYNPDHDGAVDQKYLPEAISNYNFFDEKYRTK